MKNVKIVLCIAAVVIMLAAVTYLILPWAVGFFAVANDDLLLREAWNNPVIESGYVDWHEVSAAFNTLIDRAEAMAYSFLYRSS